MLGGTRDIIYSSMQALLYKDLDLQDYIVENPLPEKFGKVKMPKNIFVSKSFTEYPDFKYVTYKNQEKRFESFPKGRPDRMHVIISKGLNAQYLYDGMKIG